MLSFFLARWLKVSFRRFRNVQRPRRRISRGPVLVRLVHGRVSGSGTQAAPEAEAPARDRELEAAAQGVQGEGSAREGEVSTRDPEGEARAARFEAEGERS